jgi:hypothetical protein
LSGLKTARLLINRDIHDTKSQEKKEIFPKI